MLWQHDLNTEHAEQLLCRLLVETMCWIPAVWRIFASSTSTGVLGLLLQVCSGGRREVAESIRRAFRWYHRSPFDMPSEVGCVSSRCHEAYSRSWRGPKMTGVRLDIGMLARPATYNVPYVHVGLEAACIEIRILTSL